ncbi:O-antigen translocase [Candidatus Ornithobacterium hominis]|uniref:oligosaccharide flippase family protein n=1 Tax=Candidatus Ornithobacterium hominis TaxID=2497989 RepID=UPI000E9E7A5F|nr:oligosaccharide flippase family protein [Candidatus Ornithobacterium hominis]SZD72074.1 O-antigen translocase [Candidatus Ornithobacterium hominis]
MSAEKSSYRQIMKATSIFGGVQVFNILIQLIRSKVVAVLLGPAGFGIMGLLQSTIQLIQASTNFGLRTSAVKDIASANEQNQPEKISETVSVFRRLIWGTGLLGLIVTILLSPWLSELTFGNRDYTYHFVALSLVLLIEQLNTGQSVLLQGLRKITLLAKANVWGSLSMLIVSIPLFYWLREEGIVPALILGAIFNYIVYFFFTKNIQIKKAVINLKEAIRKGRPMLQLGFMLSLAGLISIACSYLLRILIARLGSIEEVGLYTAGFAIINSYVGLVFTAMSTDFFPRLSAISNNVKKYNLLISQQSEVSLIITAPLICFFLIHINWIIILLYSNKFLGIIPMIKWAIIGVLFKAVSVSTAYLILSKGNSKLFFWNEIFSNIYMLLLNICLYNFFHLKGLGFSYLIGYFLYFIQIYVVCRKKYKLKLQSIVIKKLLVYLCFASSCLLIDIFLQEIYAYILGSLFIIIVSLIAINQLDERVEFLSTLKKRFLNLLK